MQSSGGVNEAKLPEQSFIPSSFNPTPENSQVFLVNCGAIAYDLVLTYFRAHGALSDYKRLVLSHLRCLLLITDGRHKASAKKVYCDDLLRKVAEALNPGVDVHESWKIESDMSTHSNGASCTQVVCGPLTENLAKFADVLNYEQALYASSLRNKHSSYKLTSSVGVSDLDKVNIKRKRMCLHDPCCRTLAEVSKFKIKKAHEIRKRLVASAVARRTRNKLIKARLRAILSRTRQSTSGLGKSVSVDGENPLGEAVASSGNVQAEKRPEAFTVDVEEAKSKSSTLNLDLFADGSIYNQLFDEYYGDRRKEKQNVDSSANDSSLDKGVRAASSFLTEGGTSTSRTQSGASSFRRLEASDYLSPIDALLSERCYWNQSGSTKAAMQGFSGQTSALQMTNSRNLLVPTVRHFESTILRKKSKSEIKQDVINRQICFPPGSIYSMQNSTVPAGPRILRTKAVSQPAVNGMSPSGDLSRSCFRGDAATGSSRDAKLVIRDNKARSVILMRRSEVPQHFDGAPRSAANTRFRIINRKELKDGARNVPSFFAADSRTSILKMPIGQRIRSRFGNPALTLASTQASSIQSSGHTSLCSQATGSTSIGYGPRSDHLRKSVTVGAFSVASQNTTTDNSLVSLTSSTQGTSLIRPVAGNASAKVDNRGACQLLPSSQDGKACRVRLHVASANAEKRNATQPVDSSGNKFPTGTSSHVGNVRLIGKTMTKKLAGVKVAFRERTSDSLKLTSLGSRTSDAKYDG
uniref:ENT domain-containing protein n=1 Tax=Trichuris muris TaxID=70415 RepID=A0A5S6QZ01_TRIMR